MSTGSTLSDAATHAPNIILIDDDSNDSSDDDEITNATPIQQYLPPITIVPLQRRDGSPVPSEVQIEKSVSGGPEVDSESTLPDNEGETRSAATSFDELNPDTMWGILRTETAAWMMRRTPERRRLAAEAARAAEEAARRAEESRLAAVAGGGPAGEASRFKRARRADAVQPPEAARRPVIRLKAARMRASNDPEVIWEQEQRAKEARRLEKEAAKERKRLARQAAKERKTN